MITDEQINELQSLLKEATPAPWRSDKGIHYTQIWHDSEEDNSYLLGYFEGYEHVNSVELIVFLRSAAPELLRELQTLRLETERLREIEKAARATVKFMLHPNLGYVECGLCGGEGQNIGKVIHHENCAGVAIERALSNQQEGI